MTDFDFEQFQAYIRQSFVQRALPVDRCSNILFSQLVHMPPYAGFNLPFQFVEREIGYLEGHHGHTATKPAEPFSKNGILLGFMHKHFYVPGYDTWESMGSWHGSLTILNHKSFLKCCPVCENPTTASSSLTLQTWKTLPVNWHARLFLVRTAFKRGYPAGGRATGSST